MDWINTISTRLQHMNLWTFGFSRRQGISLLIKELPAFSEVSVSFSYLMRQHKHKNYLIYKDECLFVCLFVPYTNPHFWTDRNQTSHTSPPWSGRDRRVWMGPQYFTFPTFSTYFVVSWCRSVHSSWLPSPHCTTTALYPWCGACWCDVTHGGLCNKNAEKWTECVCVKMETWWDGKEVT